MTTTIGWISAAVQARMTPHTRSGLDRRRGRGDLGEGVISAAIAVLIMAFLGAAMWIGFQKMWKLSANQLGRRIT